MDTTERILKLASLGWDGKEPELEFLQRVYGVSVEIITGENELDEEITISYKVNGNYHHIIKFIKKKGIDLVPFCLRLFRTEDGKVIGPRSSFFISEDQEWT